MQSQRRTYRQLGGQPDLRGRPSLRHREPPQYNPPLLELPEQGVRLGIAGPWTVGQGKAKLGEKKGPVGLASIQSLGSADVFNVFAVSPHQVGFLGNLQPKPPLLQSQLHHQQLSVPNVIVPLGRRQAQKSHKGGASDQSQTFGTGHPLPPLVIRV